MKSFFILGVDSPRLENGDNYSGNSDLKGELFRNKTELGLPCFSSSLHQDCE